MGGFSFDVGLQRMQCIKTTRQNPWSEDPYIRGSYNYDFILYEIIKYIIMIIINGYLLWLCLYMKLFILLIKRI